MASNEAAATRDRSPAYPIMPLEAALTRLEEFENHFKRSPARPEKVGEAWNIKAKGHADRTAAALRYYGLLEYQGTGKARSIVVSEQGRKYLRAQQEETKREVVKAAALRPRQIAKFWNDWGADRPADAACLDTLVLNNGFSEAGARDFLKVYDATISFAKLSDSDKKAVVPDDNEDDEQEAPPMTPQLQGLGPKPQPGMRQPMDQPGGPSRVGSRREVFGLAEGDVTITFPDSLSPESYEDLELYLQLFLRKAKRQAETEIARRRIDRDDVPE